MNFLKSARDFGLAADEKLLQEYRQYGDLAVLSALYEKYMHLVYGVCLKYLHDEEASKDAVMQIFEELVVKVTRHDIKYFKSWLYTLSRNYCLMQLRSAKKMQYTTLDEFVELPVDLHPDSEDKEQRLTVLELCMEKLPAEQKQSIDLFFMNEKCYKEITELTGFTLNEVKSYIQNGKRNLKICMEKNGER